MARRKEPVIPDAILDQLLAGADTKTAFEQNGLLETLKKALTEPALKAELNHHLADDDGGNRCNGYGRKAPEAALTAFEAGPRGEKHAAIGKAWPRAWQEVIPFFAFPREVRRILYTWGHDWGHDRPAHTGDA
ncbi:hypothetical protein FBZ89_1242 [Nitrospirillum amazonense]|uniref:Mutator family transposase n=1 Tax=Nitrospirillum amazonense TaxID=28077 RepID=A0A560ESP0_9PROT|nr:hypothetical protein FBZ89_1242 [Nitrospirillum amazonense]